jgi:hypothetical protein
LTKNLDALSAFERGIFETAAYFTAFVQLAPGDRRREEFPVERGNRDEALRAARWQAQLWGARAMVYAVTDAGRSTLVTAELAPACGTCGGSGKLTPHGAVCPDCQGSGAR